MYGANRQDATHREQHSVMGKRQKYTPEYRQSSVKLASSGGRSVEDAAADAVSGGDAVYLPRRGAE